MQYPQTDQQTLPITPDYWHRDAIAANLARFRRVALDRPDLKPASVAVCVMTPPSGHALLITRRAAALRRHAGQWALPGGRRDRGESVQATALRELHEETGLLVPGAGVLGVLDDIATRSGYLITPIVVWGGYPRSPSVRPRQRGRRDLPDPAGRSRRSARDTDRRRDRCAGNQAAAARRLRARPDGRDRLPVLSGGAARQAAASGALRSPAAALALNLTARILSTPHPAALGGPELASSQQAAARPR
jgi:8-oxo-dGTP pyrophosphatase MutT (NUDIX family)